MRNSTLKILSLMTLTFAVACGDDPAAPMITEIDTIVLDGSMVLSHTIVEIDYRNGNEVDMVSVFENGSPQVQRTFHYDPEHHSVNQIDIKLFGSDTHTMMAKYNENLDISLIYDEVTTESNGTKLLYENGNLIAHQGPNLDVHHTYNQLGQLELSKTDRYHRNFR